MKEFNIEKALEIYEVESNITEAAKQHCKNLGIEYSEKYRNRMSRYINSNKYSKDFDNETETETNQYSNDKYKKPEEAFMPSAWDAEKNQFYTIDEYCDKYNLDKASVRSSKLVSHIAGHMVYNIAFNATIFSEEGISPEFVEEVVAKHISSVEPLLSPTPVGDGDFFDRGVMTDIHLNMDPSGEKNTIPMYNHKWGRKEVFKRLDEVINHITTWKRGNVLVLDDLGDLMDGLNSQTTRGGHHLPQTLSDKDAFRLGIDFKMYLIDNLVQIYDKVIMNNVTNDNHSFLFGFFVNDAVKRMAAYKYPEKVEYNVLERFIEHYTIGNHTFVLSHGKDSGEKKFGFKASYDPKAAEVIDDYCKAHKLYNGNYIEFSMGDQHQRIFDSTSNKDFNYHAYGAFSPPSNWVGTNFKDSSSSFDMFNIHYKKNLKPNIPLIFE